MEERENLGELYAALSSFQGEYKNPEKKSENPFFKSKYADLSSIWESVRPTFSKHGLALVQMPGTVDGCVTMQGTIVHKSGQTLTSVLRLIPKDMTPQAVGSAITYARRYQMCAMLGIAPEDEDDDGQAAQGKPVERQEAKSNIITPIEKIREYEKRARAKSEETHKEFAGIVDSWCRDVSGKDFNDMDESEYCELVKHIETYYKTKKAGK